MTDETRDFDHALELLAQLEGRAVAVALLVPRASPATTAVMHGTLDRLHFWIHPHDLRTRHFDRVRLEFQSH